MYEGMGSPRGGCMVVYGVRAESSCILRGGQKHGRRGGKVGLGL